MSTSTQNVEQDPGVLEPQPKRQHRWSGGKRIGALAAAAVGLAVITALLIIQSRDEAPATDQTPVAAGAQENTVNARAEKVATGFVEAYGAFDVEQAMTYLADDATIAVLGAQDDLRLLIPYLEATGYQQFLDSCEEVGNSASSTIRCTYDFHALRSGEIGRGPFSGSRRGPFGGSSFDLVVRDGKIVEASQSWEIEKFSPQVWEPFANWVSKAYPKDAAVMYMDETHSNVRLTEESIPLWERHTRAYVEEVARRD
jgi:hypothetical protein